MKKKQILRAYAWVYILIAIVVIAGWIALFNALDRVRDNEQLTVTVLNPAADTAAMRDDLLEALPTLTDQKLVYVYVDGVALSADDAQRKTRLSLQTLQSDLVIVPESLLRDLNIAELFPPLPDALLPENTSGCYTADGKIYGVPVSGTEDKTRAASYGLLTEKCYLFVSGQSVNLGGYLGRGAKTDDAALAAFRYLTEVIDH